MFDSTFLQACLRLKTLLASLLPSTRNLRSPKAQASGHLTVLDSRTGNRYEIPIQHNAIEAMKFKEIRALRDPRKPADKAENGLRVLDHGFQNTAVMESEITYVDGIEGQIFYRGHSITELVGKKKFEDVTFLLIWGHLPTSDERAKYKHDLADAMAPPQMVFDVIQAFPSA